MFDSLVSEHDDVVEEAPAAGRALTGGLPEEAGRVDDGAEEDGAGDVAEQPEDHELDAQGERLLLLFHRSASIGMIWSMTGSLNGEQSTLSQGSKKIRR